MGFLSRIVIVSGLTAVAAAGLVETGAADWPEWRGAGRAGVWSEEGILEKFPEAGLSYSWRVPIHEGYAGPAVADGRVFVADFVRGEGVAGVERALCLDEATGKPLWTHESPVDYTGTQSTWANGPRATPTVDGERVYFQGGMGTLSCLDAGSGAVKWRRDFVKEYGSTVPSWGYASAPIVDGRLLIALVGGEKKALVVAFDKTTGEEVWRALPSRGEVGYAAPVIVEAGGVRQLIVWHPVAVSSLDPATGRVWWSEPFESAMGMSVATPVLDGRRLLVSAFFNGAMLLELEAGKPKVKRVWRHEGKSELPEDTKSLHSLITTPVIDGDTIYGIDSYGELRGLSAASGERLWESQKLIGEKARWAAGLIVRHGDRFFVNTDRGDLVIARFTPTGYEEIDRTALIEPTTDGGGKRELGAVNWSHPAYANGHIVARNDREIVRASLRAKPADR